MRFCKLTLLLVLIAALPACHKEQATIEGKRWLLTELMGQEIKSDHSQQVYFRIDPATRKVEGFAGCNRFFGEVQLTAEGRIRFANMGATQMACDRLDLERRLLDVLEQADNFTLGNGVLALNKARMASLARFTAAQAH
jgi:heat shock protein HslJ